MKELKVNHKFDLVSNMDAEEKARQRKTELLARAEREKQEALIRIDRLQENPIVEASSRFLLDECVVIVECDDGKKVLSFWRAVSFFLFLILVVAVYTIDTAEDIIVDLEGKAKTVANAKENLTILHNRIDELEAANEALIEVCRPSEFKEVLKLTPLPKMERV